MFKFDERRSDEFLVRARAKILTVQAIAEGRGDKRIVLTKGVFDLLHSGHLALFSLLDDLRASEDMLSVVAVASDDVVRRKKGSTRPIQPFSERALQVAMHPAVDAVVENTSPDLGTLVAALNPAVLIKGQDTAVVRPESSDGSALVLDEEDNPELRAADPRTRVVLFRDAGQTSTSDLVRRILLGDQ